MAATQSVTGRGGSAKVNNVTIGITRWEATITRALADATDSNNYDSTSGQTFQSQAEGVVGIDGTLEGNYDLSGTTDANFSQKLVAADGPYPVVLGLTPSVNFASLNADFENVRYSVSVPGATMITFSCSFKSNGKPTVY